MITGWSISSPKCMTEYPSIIVESGAGKWFGSFNLLKEADFFIRVGVSLNDDAVAGRETGIGGGKLAAVVVAAFVAAALAAANWASELGLLDLGASLTPLGLPNEAERWTLTLLMKLDCSPPIEPAKKHSQPGGVDVDVSLPHTGDESKIRILSSSRQQRLLYFDDDFKKCMHKKIIKLRCMLAMHQHITYHSHVPFGQRNGLQETSPRTLDSPSIEP